MNHLTDTFISALRKLEEHDDVETIASLFSHEAVLSNPSSKRDSATAFWSAYRGAFDKVRSAFVGVAAADGIASSNGKAKAKSKATRCLTKV